MQATADQGDFLIVYGSELGTTPPGQDPAMSWYVMGSFKTAAERSAVLTGAKHERLAKKAFGGWHFEVVA